MVDPTLPARQEPLHTRSWTLQEHLLSPRVLMYGSEQTFWFCDRNVTSAVLQYGGRTQDPQIGNASMIRGLLLNHTSNPERSARHYAWKKLVEEYSPRRQSVLNDKIHALRGVAVRFQTFIRDEYIAGFWRSGLPMDLLWGRADTIHPRPPRQSPSWSWMSIDSRIIWESYAPNDDLETDFRLFDLRLLEVQHNTSKGIPDPFGLLPHSVLRLNGRLLKVESPDWEQGRLFKSTLLDGRATGSLTPAVNRMALDAVSSESNPDEVWCLPIAVRRIRRGLKADAGKAVAGIILGRDSLFTDVFHRLGYFMSPLDDELRFLSAERQDISIR